MYQVTEDGNVKARQLFEEAIALDPRVCMCLRRAGL